MRLVFSRLTGRRRAELPPRPGLELPPAVDPQQAAPLGPNEAERQHRAEFWAREELIALLSVAGTLAGLSVTVVAFMDKPRGHSPGAGPAATMVDDLFSLCALLFLVCVYLIFIALRTRSATGFRRLVKLVDVAFAAGLTMMTAAGFVLVYTVW